jgi:hypothetical protein
MSREGPPNEGCLYGVSATSAGIVAGADPEGHEKTYLDLNVRKPPVQRVPLNFAPAQKEWAADR